MSKPANDDILKFGYNLDNDKGRNGTLTIPVKFLIYESKTDTLIKQWEQTIQQPCHEGVLTLVKMKAQADGIPFDEAIMIFVRALTNVMLEKENANHPEARTEVQLNGKITWEAKI